MKDPKISRQFLSTCAAILVFQIACGIVKAEIVHNPDNVPVTLNVGNPSATINIAGDSSGVWDDLALELMFFDSGSDIISTAYALTQGYGCYVRPAVSDFGEITRLMVTEPIDLTLMYSPVDDWPYFYDNVMGGQFMNQTGYAGLKLYDGVNTYFGWALIETNNYNNPDATLTVLDWAYENVPDEPILAGDIGQTEPEPCPNSFCNPSMEDTFINGIAKYWGGWGDGSFEEEVFYAHEGSKSQEINWLSCGPGPDTFGPAGIYQQITQLQQGQIYCISAWFKFRFEAYMAFGGWANGNIQVGIGVDPNGGTNPDNVTDWSTQTDSTGSMSYEGPWLNVITFFSPNDTNSTLFIKANGDGDAQEEDWECPDPPCIGPAPWGAYCYIDDVNVQLAQPNPDSNVTATSSIPANGASASEVTITVINTESQPVQWIPPSEIDVNCTGDSTFVIGPGSPTDANGQTTALITSNTAGLKTVSVSVLGVELTQKPTIEFCESDFAQLRPSDGADGDSFGCCVAMDGNLIIVGADGDDDNGHKSGSAYIFRDNGSGWVEEDKLFASDGGALDYFGSSVSIDINTVIVGAPEYNYSSNGFGSAYIFRYNGSNWMEEQELLASDGAEDDWFGYSVAIDDNIVIVGAPGDDDNGSLSGSAYIFTPNNVDPNNWVQQAKLTASDGAEYDWFGQSVSIDGNIVIVGAYADDDNGSSSGSAYIFRYNGSNWVEEQKLLASDGAEDDSFGRSVAIDGNIVIVGADGDDDNGSSSGSAYIFRYNGSNWVEQQKLLASDGTFGDDFGGAVAIDGSTIVVGAAGDMYYGYRSGSAYIFYYNGSGWVEHEKLLASDVEEDDGFGSAVATSDKTVVIGTPTDEYYSDDPVGSAYIFPVLFGDINRDGCIDFIDFAYLAKQWLECPDKPSADIAPCGGDCIVDLFDLKRFCDNWLAGK